MERNLSKRKRKSHNMDQSLIYKKLVKYTKNQSLASSLYFLNVEIKHLF